MCIYIYVGLQIFQKQLDFFETIKIDNFKKNSEASVRGSPGLNFVRSDRGTRVGNPNMDAYVIGLV